MARELFKHTVLLIVLFVQAIDGEKFFQYRDHRDQSKYISHQTSQIVHNDIEAEVQLEKYGYLRCRVRRKRSSMPDFGISEGIHPIDDKQIEADLPLCSEEQVSEAIREYQRKYKLPETGILDEVTKKLMSTSRCGNKDQEEALEATESTDQSEQSVDISKVAKVLQEDTNFQTMSSKFGNKFKNGNRPWKRSAKSTAIMRALTDGFNKDVISHERRKYIYDYINDLKKENSELLKPYTEEERQKRSVTAHLVKNESKNGEGIWDGKKLTKSFIRWRLLKTGFSTRIPVEEQRASLNLAFRMWSEVVPLKFEEDVSGDIKRVDIEIAFGRGIHQNCGRKFDGHGGEIAHSNSGRNVHFDDEEDYKSMETITMEKDGIYLLRVAVHEIGHVLGLVHTHKSYSIMYAIYHQNKNPDKEFELGWEDRKEIQKLYGVCRGRFNTVFDWVRKRPDNKFIYNTYFFRKNHYWMYENRVNRTRYGDPLYIAREWDGLPNDLDGYLHVWYFSGKTIVDEAFFFKGDKYYKYNSEMDKIYSGWPRLISEDFGPKAGETEGIPNDIDTVLFDMRDRNIYFFKDDMVYVFDPKEPKETRGCCVRKRKIWEEFPPAEGDDPIEGNLDSAYYSYNDQRVYFFKGEDVWQNILFHPRQKQIRNSVKKLGNWYNKWFDICDVRKMDSPPHGEGSLTYNSGYR